MMQLKSHELAVETSYTQHPNGSSSAEFNLVPGPGTHYFRFKGAWMRIVRERDAKLMDLHSGTPWETVVLTTLSKDRELFKDLLREAREWSERETEGKTVVYTAWGVEWRPFGKPRRRREMGSVVLGEGVSERIEKDLRSFLGRGRWYADRGECLGMHGFSNRYRNPVPTWISASRTSRIGEDFFHPGVGRCSLVQYLSSQSFRTRSDGRQVESPARTRPRA
jgi:hypothetical protein